MTLTPDSKMGGAVKDPFTTTNAGPSQESVPSYEEATTGGSTATTSPPAQKPASTPNQTNGATQLYPFPSLGTANAGYGQSPYQSDGTLRIAISPAASHGNAGPDGPLLPLPGSQARRGPRAGRRFCVAFFWAIVLYIILGIVTGAIIDMDNEARHKPTKPSPPSGGPPGWHHHHDGNRHRHEGSAAQRLDRGQLPHPVPVQQV